LARPWLDLGSTLARPWVKGKTVKGKTAKDKPTPGRGQRIGSNGNASRFAHRPWLDLGLKAKPLKAKPLKTKQPQRGKAKYNFKKIKVVT
jgi:hypothetical protein